MSDTDIIAAESEGGVVDIEAIVQVVMARMSGVIDDLKEEITEKFEILTSNTQSWLNDIVGAIGNWLATPLDNINSTLNLVFDTLTKWKESVGDIISSVIAEVQGWIETVVEKLEFVFDDLFQSMKDIIVSVQDAISTLKETIIETIQLVIETVKAWLVNLWDTLITGLKWLGDKILTGIQAIVNYVKNTFTNIYNALKAGYENLKAELTIVYDRSIIRIKEVMNIIAEELKEHFEPMILAFVELWDYFKAILVEMKTVPEDAIAEVVYTLMKVQKRVLLRLIEEEGKG